MKKTLTWMGVLALVCGLLRVAYSDNYSSSTSVERYTKSGTQIWNLDNSGMLTIGPGTATNGTTRLDLAPSLAGQSSFRIEQGVAPTSPVDGDQWYDSTQKCIVGNWDGISQRESAIMLVSTGPAVINNTTAVSTITTNATLYGTTTLPANFFVTGKTIRYRVLGNMSTITNPGNFTLNVVLGTTTVATTGTAAAPSAVSSKTFSLDGLVTDVATGGFGTGAVISQFQLNMTSGTFAGGGIWEVASSTTATTSIDTTASNNLLITVQWATANGGNMFLPTNIVYEILN